MPVAFNSETDSAVFLDQDGGWKPAPIAKNPQTGERVAFDGSDWVPLKMPNISQPKSFSEGMKSAGEFIADRFKNPPSEPSLIGMAGHIYRGLTDPVPMEQNLGLRTEDGSTPPLVKRAFDLSSTALLTSAGSAARRGVDPNALGMGFVPRGSPPPATPVAAPLAEMAPPLGQQVVEKATNLGVPVPRYMVDESRMTQGLAAGLQNIPGAGDKIAEAASTTMKALGGAAEKVQQGYGTGSPAVAGSYAKDALSEWIGPESKKVAARVYDSVDNLVNPSVTTPLKSTGQAAQTILDRRANARIPGESAAVKSVMDAATTPGGLNYEGVKGLRSFLGEMTDQEIISQGLKASEVKQLYSALTNDLRMSVLNGGGPKALGAFNKANTVYDNIAARRDQLSKIIGVKGDAAPEAVFARIHAMAGSKASADSSRLVQARKTMGSEAWNEVASAVISKLGRDANGEFSITRFLGPNGYSGLSPAGKTALFRSTGKDDLARSLDDIHFVSTQLDSKLKQFYNPSGTGKSLVSTATVYGMLQHPIKTLATITGGTKLAAHLAEPATARATADWLKSYRTAIISPHANASKAVREAAEKLADIIAPGSGFNSAQIATRLLPGAIPASELP